jgi:hypothetical protein
VRVVSQAKFMYCGVRSRLRLTLWRNYPPLLAIGIEFLQLMSISLRQQCVPAPAVPAVLCVLIPSRARTVIPITPVCT